MGKNSPLLTVRLQDPLSIQKNYRLAPTQKTKDFWRKWHLSYFWRISTISTAKLRGMGMINNKIKRKGQEILENFRECWKSWETNKGHVENRTAWKGWEALIGNMNLNRYKGEIKRGNIWTWKKRQGKSRYTQNRWLLVSGDKCLLAVNTSA